VVLRVAQRPATGDLLPMNRGEAHNVCDDVGHDNGPQPPSPRVVPGEHDRELPPQGAILLTGGRQASSPQRLDRAPCAVERRGDAWLAGGGAGVQAVVNKAHVGVWATGTLAALPPNDLIVQWRAENLV